MNKANFGLIAAILFLTLAGGSAFAETPKLPGMVEGTGTHFEVTDSTYLNISLNSSEPIKAMLQSAPEMVMMYVESASGASSTTITLSGFAPNTTYYKYEDDFHNPVEFITDEAGDYSYTQDLSKEHVVFIQTEKSTKFIRDDATGGDCYLIGTWDAGTKTCTLTMDVIDLIQIDGNGIVLEGAGHTVSWDISGISVYSTGKTGITIKNLNLENFFAGIYLVNCSNSNITGNTISESYHGIYLLNSENNVIEENTMDLHTAGVFLWFSGYTTVKYNTLSNNSVYGIFIFSSNNSQVYNNNFIENGITPSGAQAEVYDSTGNDFNLPKPTGGNYWSDYNTEAEDCLDTDGDGFYNCPYTFAGGQDNLPLVEPFSPEPGPEDTIPPITTISLSGTAGDDEWYVSDVEVTLTATDEGGTVALIEYSFDETGWNTYSAPFAVSDEGTATVYFRSTDDSDNVEATKSETVKVDKTPPTITIATPTAQGTYAIGMALDFSANDLLSGALQPIGELTNSGGETQQVESGFKPEPGVYTLVVEATDQAGNTAVSDTVNFVVYDPKRGSARGSGWFHPDKESSLPSRGRAKFSFVAKYKKGGFTGRLSFHFKEAKIKPKSKPLHFKKASIRLKSKTIDWLVISGTSAEFQGTGAIKGKGLYTFRVKAEDNGKAKARTDHFDIRIWEGTDTEADPVYSAKNTLKGGNIVIPKKSRKK